MLQDRILQLFRPFNSLGACSILEECSFLKFRMLLKKSQHWKTQKSFHRSWWKLGRTVLRRRSGTTSSSWEGQKRKSRAACWQVEPVWSRSVSHCCWSVRGEVELKVSEGTDLGGILSVLDLATGVLDVLDALVAGRVHLPELLLEDPEPLLRLLALGHLDLLGHPEILHRGTRREDGCLQGGL